jgi:predicted aminopeptidase
MPPFSSRSSRPTAPASSASATTRSAVAASGLRTSRHAKAALALLLLLGAFGTSGCYLTHVATGQLRLLRARQPIEAVLADPATPPQLRQRLELVQRARAFAVELGLEVGEQYTSYVAWPGDRIVTTVVAARPGEVESVGFWFPIVGRLPYKGFFDPDQAAAEAARLRARGHDVCEVPVSAYSTLGWFADPVTGPMLRTEPGVLVETILHELVHATVYLRGHVDFDEGVASFIGEEASVRFYSEAGSSEAATRRRARVEENRRLDARILAFRERVKELYESVAPGGERDVARLRYEDEARSGIAVLPFAGRDGETLASGLRLNDACLALAATYASDMPRYADKLEALGGDLRAFVARLRGVSDAPDPRAALLAP